jgi:hypothetical protein
MTRQTEPMISEPLSTLGEVFRNFRKSSGKEKCHFPFTLKRRAVTAVNAGQAIAKVAIACGISPQSLRGWMTQSPPPARRLSIVKETEEKADSREVTHTVLDSVFQFRLQNGVTLEASPGQTLWILQNVGGANRCGLAK